MILRAKESNDPVDVEKFREGVYYIPLDAAITLQADSMDRIISVSEEKKEVNKQVKYIQF